LTKVKIQDLLDAGVHFGHQTKRWNPKMREYIFGARNGIYIMDLTKTMHQLEKACKFLFETILDGGDVLFVGTKRQAQETIREAADVTNMHFICERWLGGTLTNSQTIRKSVSLMESIQKIEDSGEMENKPKKEAASLRKRLYKLQRNLSGIARMVRLPKALIVVDVQYEDIAVKEAKRLNIPVVGMVDTNSNPDGIDYVVPGNDDAQRAIKVILDTLSSTIKTAQEINLKRLEEQKAEEERKAALEKAENEKAETAADDEPQSDGDESKKDEAAVDSRVEKQDDKTADVTADAAPSKTPGVNEAPVDEEKKVAKAPKKTKMTRKAAEKADEKDDQAEEKVTA
jgi:small subunit ribosomal protein S2